MKRPDTGKREAMIMEMAGSIIDGKIDYYNLILEQKDAKGEQQTETYFKIWQDREDLIKALKIIDKVF